MENEQVTFKGNYKRGIKKALYILTKFGGVWMVGVGGYIGPNYSVLV